MRTSKSNHEIIINKWLSLLFNVLTDGSAVDAENTDDSQSTALPQTSVLSSDNATTSSNEGNVLSLSYVVIIALVLPS